MLRLEIKTLCFIPNFFKGLNKIFITPRVSNNVKTNFLAYPIILKKGVKFSRKEFQIFLEKNKIQTRPIFSGNILRHPAFRSLISKKNQINNFKASDYIMKYGLLIGLPSRVIFKRYLIYTSYCKKIY